METYIGWCIILILSVGQISARTIPPLQREDAVTLSNEEQCPLPYVTVGGRCLFFYALETGTWHNARQLCEQLQGHLAKINTGNLHVDVIDYIHQQAMDNYGFWLGANDEAEENVWKWHDGTSVKKGSPFWGYLPKDPIHQEPIKDDHGQNCCGLPKPYLYYFHDYKCNDERLSPLCEFNGDKYASFTS